jgi:hypothetical protein
MHLSPALPTLAASVFFFFFFLLFSSFIFSCYFMVFINLLIDPGFAYKGVNRQDNSILPNGSKMIDGQACQTAKKQ